MKDLIEEVALKVAEKFFDPEMDADHAARYVEACIVELTNRVEAVGQTIDADSYGLSVHFPMGIPEAGTKLFNFPPIHDIEAIEDRVAEACAKWVKANIRGRDGGSFIAEAIRSGAWRKYK